MSLQSETVIQVSDVTKRYKLFGNLREQIAEQMGFYKLRFWRPAPDFREVAALQNVAFRVRKGERIGIVGRNGAGKTTLLKMISGNFAPTDGSISVTGTVQALMQSTLGVHPEFTGYDNIYSTLIYNGLRGARLQAAIEDVIDFVELGKFLHQPMKTYSLGMQARLRFAAATAIDPDILIIDEMLGAGDAYFSVKSARRIEDLTSHGCTLLLVSHSAQQVLQFCERALWLDHGRLVADGPAEEIVSRYERELSRQSDNLLQHPADGSLQDPHFSMANRQFLRAKILPLEPIAADLDQEQVVMLDGGGRAFSWPGRTPGVRISGARLLSEGVATAVLETGGDACLELMLSVDPSHTDPFCCEVSIYDMHGALVSRTQGEMICATTEGKVAVEARLTPLLLGAGEYICSVAVFDGAAMGRHEPGIRAAHRLDLLSRCIHFNVQESNDPGPPLLHCPAVWEMGKNAPAAAAIQGWV